MEGILKLMSKEVTFFPLMHSKHINIIMSIWPQVLGHYEI